VSLDKRLNYTFNFLLHARYESNSISRPSVLSRDIRACVQCALDNGPAKEIKNSYLLRDAGEAVGDMIEISTIRREDYEFHTGLLLALFNSNFFVCLCCFEPNPKNASFSRKTFHADITFVFIFHAGKSEYEDVLQCNNAPSSRTPRGHQSPSAFLIMTSGLDKVPHLKACFSTLYYQLY